MKRTPTTKKLARALKKLNNPRISSEMIQRAIDGYYDDFKSPLVFPLQQLAHDIREAGHPEFVQRIIDGEFDAPKWESDEWAASPEGQSVFQEFLKGLKNERS